MSNHCLLCCNVKMQYNVCACGTNHYGSVAPNFPGLIRNERARDHESKVGYAEQIN